MSVLDPIAPEEDLGRGIFSSKQARRARRSGVRLNVFLERPGQLRISVDRLSLASEDAAVAVAESVAVARGARFHGWAVITADLAGANGRRVVATPVPTNPFHADIVLPELAAHDLATQRKHAQQLADASRWRGRPSGNRSS